MAADTHVTEMLTRAKAENAALRAQLEQQARELAAAREQQTATSEILRVIAGSPTNPQPILDAVAESAARLCGATDAIVVRLDGDTLRAVATIGTLPRLASGDGGIHLPVDRQSVVGRAVVDRQTIHVPDVAAVAESEFPAAMAYQRRAGYRTALAAPLLREGVPIGAIGIYRPRVLPFTDEQIALLETFADQAVIAIENTRLFQELQERNRQLSEALEQQTVTADVLRVISSSPTDLQVVLDAVVSAAARLCEADAATIGPSEGEWVYPVANYRVPRDFAPLLSRMRLRRGDGSVPALVFEDMATVMLSDATNEPRLGPAAREIAARYNIRSLLAVPLLRGDALIGMIVLWRMAVRPFTEAQITLVETFADQAVIAIESTRLFRELQERNRELTEALEQQTATADILRLVSQSPADVQPVLDGIAAAVARLCDGVAGMVYLVSGDMLRRVGAGGPRADVVRATLVERPITPDFAAARSLLDRQPFQLYGDPSDYEAEFPTAAWFARQTGLGSGIFMPLIRDNVPIGVISVLRELPSPFTAKQIALLETFADQAIIAIGNTQLFQELQQRTQELARSVEQLTALSVTSQAVSSSLDLQQVLTTIVAHADELAGTDGGVIYEFDESHGEFHVRAARRFDEHFLDILRANPVRLGEGAIGRAAAVREPVQIADIVPEGAYPGRLREVLMRAGFRAVLAIPLLREEQVIGGLVLARKTPGAFPPTLVELVKTFAAQSTLAIHNARLFQQCDEYNCEL